VSYSASHHQSIDEPMNRNQKPVKQLGTETFYLLTPALVGDAITLGSLHVTDVWIGKKLCGNYVGPDL